MQVTLTENQLLTLSHFLNSQANLPKEVSDLAEMFKDVLSPAFKEEAEASIIKRIKKAVTK